MPGYICGPKVYKYKDCVFEFHSYMGPCPLTKKGDPFKRIPNKFWKLWDEFDSLSEEEKDKYFIGGGCRYFP